MTVWGPPGAVLVVVAAAGLAQRLGSRRFVHSSWLSLIAIVTLMLGVTETWLELTAKVPDAAQFRDLNTIIDGRREAADGDSGLPRIIAELRWDLGERLARR